jgi:hypothetical protein
MMMLSYGSLILTRASTKQEAGKEACNMQDEHRSVDI